MSVEVPAARPDRTSELESARPGRALLTRTDLERPGVRVLNLGGVANPDVLMLRAASGRVVVVKDYAGRSRWLRRWLAPWLVQRELALLHRVAGAPGVPRPLGRIDALAFALEWIDADPLRRRSHAAAVPPSFFAALEAILEALRVRGVFYTDLRSPTNVLCTPTRAPVLVDLASAVRLPLPRSWADAYYGRALAKLRGRFEAGAAEEPALGRPGPAVRALQSGWERIRVLDAGPGWDPVPAIFVPDAGSSLEAVRAWPEAAPAHARRGLGIELPGVGGSRAGPRLRAASVGSQAEWLARALRALRVQRLDLVAWGWAGLVARTFAERHPARVRVLATLDTPVDRLDGRFLRLWESSRQGAESFRAAVDAEREGPAAEGPRALLTARAAYRSVEVAPAGHAGWQLARAGVPRAPWLAIETAPAGAAESRVGYTAMERAVRLRWPAQRSAAELWKELTAIAARATVAGSQREDRGG